jgi:CHAT domain-containing protein
MRIFGRSIARLVLTGILTIAALLPLPAQAQDLPTLMQQLVALAQAGRYGEAVPLARKLVSEAEKAAGADSLLTATTRLVLAQALLAQGQAEEAEALFKGVLVVREKALGASNPVVVDPLKGLAQIALDQNRLADAEQHISRAIAVEEKAFGPDHLNTALTRMPLGDLRHRQLRDAEALDIFSRALDVFRKSPGPAEIMVAVALNNIAEVYRQQGHLQQAEERYREALAIQEKLRGSDSLYITPMLNNLGELRRLQGRLGDAEMLARRALAIREKALGPEHPDVAASLSNLAIVFSREGRAVEAEGLLRRALAIEKKAFGPDHPNVAIALNNIADALSHMGRDKEAEQLFRRSLAIREKGLGPNHIDVAVSLDNLAVLLGDDNRYSEAEPLARRSLNIRESALGEGHPLIANSLNNLAVILDNTGRPLEAGPLLKRALEIRSGALGERHPDVANSLSNLASHYADLDDWRQAYDNFNRATSILIGRHALTSSDGSTAARVRDDANPFRGSLRAAYKLAERSDRQTADMLRSRAFESAQWIGDDQAANAIAGMSARVAAGSGELASLVRERQDLNEQALALDQTLIAAASHAAGERNLATEQALQTQASQIADRMRERDRLVATQFPDYASLVTKTPVPLAEAQNLLRPNEALLLFAPTARFTFVWTITRSEVRWHAAPIGAKLLAEKVAILRCGLDASAWASGSECSAKLGGAGVPTPYEALPFDATSAYELYQALLGPVETMIEGKELLLVPSGPLATLPFHVLLTETPAASAKGIDFAHAPWLARRYAATVLPSVSSLKALRQVVKNSNATRPFIGFGNPLLDGDTSNASEIERAKQSRLWQTCDSRADSRTALLTPRGTRAMLVPSGGVADIAQLKSQLPLPETAIELCAVAKSFAPAAGEVHLGAHATETEIKSLSESGRLADYRILHFATHGALAGDIQGSTEPGLILTPPAVASPVDDGYLTASEISGLKLDADWVVLSACNTAGGETSGGEAFSGLARAFFFAGTRALLVSHWAVDSDATVKLVTGTMAALRTDPKIGRAEALRRAMVSLIERGSAASSHPAVWAPFVVVGEGAR